MIAGVIDRIVDKKHAVILLEDEKKERVISVDHLPEGSKEGSWLLIDIQGEAIKHIQLDEKKTEKKQEQIKNKLTQLRARSTGSRFKRN
ncbi:DUF3006 domain-containing protein [Halalkalibacter alkalisediminis]|uniref:DUF3006 domain-containing protein n=1 Tax=Halalkalibacter alkalisediminis TaxID=935616 RepID=A0ABV6NHL6_9BACI|nr:DUF3006 domain-containing protein [Halalkalibacter alkalisediminis]